MTELDPQLARLALGLTPWGVLILRRQKILWANQSLAKMLHTLPEKIIGLTPASAPPALAALFEEHSEQLTVELNNGETRRLHRERLPLPAVDTEVHYFEDITERLNLEEERERLLTLVKTLDNRDAETGLMNRNAILLALDHQISRSRRYGNPLAAVRLTLEPPHDCEEIHHIPLREISQEFNTQLRWADQIGRLDKTTFLLVLPETSLLDAEYLAETLARDRIALASRAGGWTIGFSTAAWCKGDDARKLIERLTQSRPIPSA